RAGVGALSRGVPGDRPPGLVPRAPAKPPDGRRAGVGALSRGVPGGRPPGLVPRAPAKPPDGRRAGVGALSRGVPGGRPPGLVPRAPAKPPDGRRAGVGASAGAIKSPVVSSVFAFSHADRDDVGPAAGSTDDAASGSRATAPGSDPDYATHASIC